MLRKRNARAPDCKRRASRKQEVAKRKADCQGGKKAGDKAARAAIARKHKSKLRINTRRGKRLGADGAYARLARNMAKMAKKEHKEMQKLAEKGEETLRLAAQYQDAIKRLEQENGKLEEENKQPIARKPVCAREFCD